MLASIAVLSFRQLGQFLSTPQHLPEKADLIVTLGGDPGGRIQRAYELFAAGYAPFIVLAGGDVARMDYLLRRGVPGASILRGGLARNSWEESVDALRLMRSRGWNKVLVVSDPPHLRRLSWIWGKVFRGTDMSFRLIAAPLPGWDAYRWWQADRTEWYVRSELLKLGYFVVRYGWVP